MRQIHRREPAALSAALLVGLACGSWPAAGAPTAPAAEPPWRTFQGTWTAVGKRTTIPLGRDRRAWITDYNGSLMLSGPSRPGVGFRANAIVLNDSATGVTGRAAWTDEHGDQVYSELQGQGGPQGVRVVGRFIGGSGRYAGATGSYQFVWRFLLEGEDGTVQGQSIGLQGQMRTSAPAPPAAPPSGRPPR